MKDEPTLGDILNMAMSEPAYPMVNGRPVNDWIYYALKGEKINAIKALRLAIKIKIHKGGNMGYELHTMSLMTAKEIVESIHR